MRKCYGRRVLALCMAAIVSLTSAGISPQTAEAAKPVKAKSVSLNHSMYTLKKGKSLKLKAAVLPKNAKNKKVVWKSSKSSVAAVSAKGVVRAKKKGGTKITATVKGTKIKAVCNVSVGTPVQKITVKNPKITLEAGKSSTIKVTVAPKSASNKGVAYKSSNAKVAAVTAKGKVTAKKKGTAKVTVQAKDGSGKKAFVTVKVEAKKKPSTDVSVTSVSVSLEKSVIQVGETIRATAQVFPENAGDKKVSWSSSNRASATVDDKGMVTGVVPGTATIQAVSSNGKMGRAFVTVKDVPGPAEDDVPVQSVTVSPAEKTLQAGDTLQLQVSVKPENADNPGVRYESSAPDVASVNDKGLVTAKKDGEAVITAKIDGTDISDECRVTVKTNTEDESSVSSFEELKTALAAGRSGKITLNTQESGNFEISAAEYPGVTLCVNAPNATISNSASFEQLEIQAISKDTWIEKASGNTIELAAKQAHVQVDGENVVIRAGAQGAQIRIDGYGTIDQLVISAASEISLSGTGQNAIPIEVRAKDSVISTSIPVKVDASSDVTINIHAGAEGSAIQITDETVKLVVKGIGTVPVTNQKTGETVDVVAEYLPPEESGETQSKKGVVKGKVKGQSGTGIEGAEIYLIPYQSSIDMDNLEDAIKAAKEQKCCYEAATDANGGYTTPEAPYGNYILIFKVGKYLTCFQTVILNSNIVEEEDTVMKTGEKLAAAIEKWREYDFGENIAQEIAGKLAAAEKLLTDGADYEKLSQEADDLEKYFLGLMQSTQIADIQSPDIQKWKVCRQGERDDSSTSGSVLKGYSLILLEGVSDAVPDNIRISLSDKNAVGEMKESDKEAYSGLYVVTNNTTGAVEKYYLNYQKDVQGVRIQGIEEPGNIFKNAWNLDYSYITIGGKQYCRYPVYGYRKSLGEKGLDTVSLWLDVNPDRYEITEEAGESWTHKVTVSWQGTETILYLDYHYEADMNLLPRRAYYYMDDTGNQWQQEFESVSVVEQNGRDWIRLTGMDPEFSNWDVIYMSGPYNNVYYRVVKGEESYEVIILLDNTELGRYPLYYEQDAFLMMSSDIDIRDEGNKIVEYRPYISEDETGEACYQLDIIGENETLANPKFTFKDPEMTAVYEPLAGKYYDGILTVSCKGASRIYRVCYQKQEVCLRGVAEPGNVFRSFKDLDYDSILVGEEKYRCYPVLGYREALGLNGLDAVKPEFNVEPDRFEITEEAGESWTHKVMVSYKGEETVIYLNYRQDPELNLLPSYGGYLRSSDGGQWEESFASVSLAEQDGQKRIRLTGYEKEFTGWDSVYLTGEHANVVYKITNTENLHEAAILLEEEELERYPLYYEWDVSNAVPQLSIQDEGNNIIDKSITCKIDEFGGQYEVLCVCGENMQPGNLAISSGDADVSAVYEPVSDSSKGIGKLTLSYLTQSKEYWVDYLWQVRPLQLNAAEADGELFAAPACGWYQEGSDSGHDVYSLKGTKDALDGSEIFKLTVYGMDGQQEEVEPEYILLEPEEGPAWDYLLKAFYKGKEQTIYLKYDKLQNAELLPEQGHYHCGSQEEGYDVPLQRIEHFIDDSGRETVRIVIPRGDAQFEGWDTLSFDARGIVEYGTASENGEWHLVILQNDQEVVRYPMICEDHAVLDILDIPKEGNGIFDYQVECRDGRNLLYINGEYETLPSLAVVTDEGVEQHFDAAAGTDGSIGVLTLSYLTQRKTYDVFYAQILPVEAEQPVPMSLDSRFRYYMFIPGTEGVYHFYTEGSLATQAYLKSADGEELAYSCNGGNENNFYFSHACTAGTAYFISIASAGDAGDSTLFVSAAAPSFGANGTGE